MKEFLKAGYNVVTVNCLERWDRVGPSASMYPADEVKAGRRVSASRRRHGARRRGQERAVYRAGAGPPLQQAVSRAHPEWLRVKPDGIARPNFGNIRSGYADWLLRAAGLRCPHVSCRRFLVRRLRARASAHLRRGDPAAVSRNLRRQRDSAEAQSRFTILSRGSIWPGTSNTSSIWPTACAARSAPKIRMPVLFANYSANRTWYYPEMYMGEYPAAYCRAVDVSSVELYWDVPGDALYQQFCCAFVQGVTDNRGGSVWIQPSEHGVSGVSSPVEIQLRGLEGRRGEFIRSSSSRPGGKSISNNTSPM